MKLEFKALSLALWRERERKEKKIDYQFHLNSRWRLSFILPRLIARLVAFLLLISLRRGERADEVNLKSILLEAQVSEPLHCIISFLFHEINRASPLISFLLVSLPRVCTVFQHH
jgi:hypothetical protein